MKTLFVRSYMFRLVAAVGCTLVASGAVFAQSADAWRQPYTGREATGPHVVGLWQFDEEKELTDAAGRNPPARLDGAVIHPEGRFGSCLESFPGWPVSDKRHALVVPNRPELSPRGAFTLELWIKAKPELAEYAGHPYLLDKKYVAHADYQLTLGAASADGARAVRLNLGFGDDSQTWSSDPVRFAPDEWRHLAATYDAAGTVRFYLDGEPIGGGARPGRGGVAAGSHPLSIGDRLGSNYGGFPGYLDEVRITTGVREFRAAPVTDVSRRRVFVRHEASAPLRYRVTNALSRPLENARATIALAGVDAAAAPPKTAPLPPLAPGEHFDLEYDFPTHLRPAEYRATVRIEAPGAEDQERGYQGEESFAVRLTPRPLPHRMPVVMWGIGGVDGVVEELPRLKEIGFTHCLGLSADYGRIFQEKQPVTATDEKNLEATYRMLDEALAHDFRIVVSLSPGRWLSERPGFARINRQGQPYPRKNLANAFPEIDEFFYNVGASVAQTWGDFPALDAALIHTEVRDGTALSFHPREKELFREYAGFDIPEAATQSRGVDYTRLADFPADRVIADDHPLLTFYRWFWKEGDGWNRWHSAVHRGLRSTDRRDLWTFFDPAVRAPSVWGSGGDVDYLSHWTYTYPDPLRIGLCADELLAMAAGKPAGSRGADSAPQRVMKMTQIIWYRSQTAPTGKAGDQAARSPWEDFDPDAAYITIAPMHLREALWTKLSRPVQGIMYHGWQSLVPTESTSGYRYTHPETQHELARLVREVVQPLGPTLRQVPDAPADVAFLESFTSQMFARRGTYGWGHSWAADLWLTLQHAHLQPEIVYEETILRDGLDRYRVLVLPDCDVLPRSVADRISQFQKQGGLVIGDERLAPAIKADVVLPVFSRAKRAKEDKAALVAGAARLREQLAGRYTPYVDVSDPEVIARRRRYGESDYVFVVNDRREFGSYVGQHGLVMENGLPSSAHVRVHRGPAYVYDLRAGQAVAAKAGEGKHLTWSVNLGPCDGGLFLVTPRPIERLTVAAPESAQRGASAEVQIAVTDANNQPLDAVLPLYVKIRDPDGRLAEHSGHYGAAGGQLTLTLDFAANDTPGVWQIETRDLASGRTTQVYLRLE